MGMYVVLVWWDGLGKGGSEVLGHYRTEHDSLAAANRAVTENPGAVFNVYKLVY